MSQIGDKTIKVNTAILANERKRMNKIKSLKK